jgi:hypothetical protein
VTASLDSEVKYETVSYVWGDDHRRHTLFLGNGTSLPITDSLCHALPRLSKVHQTGYLWVDQICIDQSNVQERNHQVKIMGEIYARS